MTFFNKPKEDNPKPSFPQNNSSQVTNQPREKNRILHESLSDYERVVTKLANIKSAEGITNAGKDYARIIMKNIFRTSESSVLIFARGLNEGVSEGEYLNELENFLKRETSFLTVL